MDVAVFHWSDFPYLSNAGELVVSKSFRVLIDLGTRKMVRASVDERELSAKDAVVLIAFNRVSASHVLLHSYANWATNIEGNVSSFVKTMGLATITYNYLGDSMFPRLMKFFFYMGWTSHDFHAVSDVFEHGTKKGVCPHAAISDLRQHSGVIDFVYKLRGKFMASFMAHKDELPGVDGEALFIGTVLHSLDHSLYEKTMRDILWIEPDCDEFKAVAELCRIVRASFVEDLPFLLFRKSYKHAPDGFYRSVYKHAVNIRPDLADLMDAAVIK